ncbi:MAG TPA: phosphatase PAP2 family protein [Solirubrobacterales bacterium]|nr:phosphatase PAP2 family protein [Solirubrobacterales bacterium]
MFRLIVPLAILLVLAGLLRWHSKHTGRAPRLRWLPKGGSDALLQLSLFVMADILYETVRGVAESNAATAFSNARVIVELEQNTGLFFEQGLQTWAMGQRVLIDFANFMYVNSHFVMTTTVLVWLYLRHNERFYFVRNMFMVAMGLALVGYVLMPTAPPRFFPELGFVDTIAYYVNVKHDSGLVALFFNPYAAVPSMHVAFALMISIPTMLIVRNRAAKVFWALYPLLVSFVVVVTGNHWVFDAIVGAAVAGTSALVAQHVLSRLWPAAWSWSGVPRGATA